MSRKTEPGPDGPEAPGSGSLDELRQRLRERTSNGHRIDPFDEDTLMENLHLTNAYYDQNLPGRLESGRRVLGPFLSLVKRVARRLMGWYVNPAMDNQRLFNAYVTRSINDMKRYLDHLQINEDILSTIMRRDLALFRANILFMNRYLQGRMLDFENEINLLRGKEPVRAPPVEKPAGNGDGEADELLDSLDVLTLEQRIHGSPRMVRDRQRVYLPYLRGCRNFLAIGCGRGELLQILSREGINARGIESDATLVGFCRDNDLDVSKVDVFDYLEALPNGSLDGVVLSRFAGHQPPGRLIRMLNLCRKKLEGDAVLIIETPNPFSLYAVANYALEDSDRIHPMHPETLKLLCLSCGFMEPTVMFLNPLPPEENLEELELSSRGAIIDPHEQELFHQVNQNFVKINRILFSHREYAVVTRCGDLVSS
ncbi:MAG: class I SAM-dependent methyltransferase [Actinobacteria bacterium]|nr:class I SAM-dependent methyltransferase [Actinomycetota bacterium]MCG2817458.1 class I SAM-dependent methyltransferase [Actinomycetes bacterium]MBU4178463.1 class I SAM-dependent methyltransferase [Actinomycetota bacterium]MBU4217941.1 class I SAM-dependent methyltransferase [Actinomycetota bacterium]MBU4360026.1 class I SAM-dependent methyltransferase [Actinomycetota bacterium]